MMFRRKKQVEIALDFPLASVILLILLSIFTMIVFTAFIDYYNAALAFKPTRNMICHYVPQNKSLLCKLSNQSQPPTAAAGVNNTNRTNATSLGNMICHYVPQNRVLLCHIP